jgi:hypothetical protein
MAAKRNADRILVGKQEGNRPLGRQRRRWVDVKLALSEIVWDGMDWIYLAQDRDQWTACEHSNEPSGSTKCWEALESPHIRWLLKKSSASMKLASRHI